MALTAKPPTNVVLAISSGDTIEATVSPKSRSFTPNDWNVPQTVVVAGVDDESPRISDLAHQTLNEDTTATIPFLVSDMESAADVLLVTAT